MCRFGQGQAETPRRTWGYEHWRWKSKDLFWWPIVYSPSSDVLVFFSRNTLFLFQANALASALEKKQKSFDKIIAEWKAKVDDLAAELDASQKECRNYSTEVFKVKAAYEENQEALEAVRRENKNLAGELQQLPFPYQFWWSMYFLFP